MDKGRMSDRVRQILAALAGLRFGAVEIVVHDGRIVQIERREKVRLATDGRALFVEVPPVHRGRRGLLRAAAQRPPSCSSGSTSSTSGSACSTACGSCRPRAWPPRRGRG
ncbi:MAG: YezD family protein [Gemmatimonadetes bacterium]|nr:YezD family protein [Gemmatimonadota bacterium]